MSRSIRIDEDLVRLLVFYLALSEQTLIDMQAEAPEGARSMTLPELISHNIRQVSNDRDWNEAPEDSLREMAYHWWNRWSMTTWPASLQKITDHIQSAMPDDHDESKPAQTPGESDTLLDLVVDALKEPLGNNLIGGGGVHLKSLRKALLDPEEQARLKAAKEKVLSCAGCSRPFVTREVLTFMTGDNESSPSLYCPQCLYPQWAPCSHKGCEEKIQIRGELGNLRQYRCEAHTEQGVAPGMLDVGILEAFTTAPAGVPALPRARNPLFAPQRVRR